MNRLHRQDAAGFPLEPSILSFFLILKLAYRYKAADIVREEQRVQFIKEMLSKCDLEVEDEGEFISSVLSEISMVKGDIMDMDHYYAKKLLRGHVQAAVPGL